MERPGRDEVRGTPEAPLALRDVARGIAGRIDAIPLLWITAEVLSLNRTRGGVFLDLVDPEPGPDRARPPTITAVLDLAAFDALPLPPERGARIVALARLSFWAGKGQVAARLLQVRLAGEGALLERIEVLRLALRREGLFEPGRKRALRPLPRVIGLITGKDTHAESDVVMRTRERWPQARFRTIHAPMQGPDCEPSVIAALRTLDADALVDVIVIARGGGSVTDLAPFSAEGLVRAVAACRTPVVSAIGHEPDHPILDEVADARAATPTHAAAVIVIDVVGAERDLDRALDRLRQALDRRLRAEEAALVAVASRPVLAAPTTVVDAQARELAQAATRLQARTRTLLTLAESSLDSTAAALRALSPEGTLARGYAIVRRADGRPLGPLPGVAAGTGLDIRVAEGHLAAVTLPGRTEDPLEEES